GRGRPRSAMRLTAAAGGGRRGNGWVAPPAFARKSSFGPKTAQLNAKQPRLSPIPTYTAIFEAAVCYVGDAATAAARPPRVHSRRRRTDRAGSPYHESRRPSVAPRNPSAVSSEP